MLISPPLVFEATVYDVIGRLDKRVRDVEYLATEIENLARNIEEVHKMIKEHMELTQSFWSMVLAFVVALYVPLSFASVSSTSPAVGTQ